MGTQPSSKHTPGPWKANNPTRNRDCSVSIQIESEMEMVCEIYEGDEKAKANARLIAAAPELLEACLYALARFEVEQSFGPHRQQLYAAIFSATGVPVDNQSDDMGQNTSSCE